MGLPVIVLAGATATGKSSLGIDLAVELGEKGHPCEIINADSMLVYRGMDIGTAKPSLTERKGVAHHLIDIMDIHESSSVAMFQGLARQAIADCRGRGVVPIVVGGSALYLHAIIDTVHFPATDPAVRARIAAEAAQIGPQAIYDRLRTLAPHTARSIEPGNTRRVIRALESIELTGDFVSVLPEWSYALAPVVHIGLELSRQEMDRRIAERVAQMWEAGFVKEVRTLCNGGLRESPTASRAIGYRQVIAYLDGEISEGQAQELTVVKTRQFSRKQLSWWRRDPRIHWLPAPSTPSDILSLLGSQEFVSAGWLV